MQEHSVARFETFNEKRFGVTSGDDGFVGGDLPTSAKSINESPQSKNITRLEREMPNITFSFFVY